MSRRILIGIAGGSGSGKTLVARTMVRVASYMANPDGLAKQELTPGQGVLAKGPSTDAIAPARSLADEGKRAQSS